MAKAKPLSKVDPYFKSLLPKLRACAEKLRLAIFEIEPNAREQLLWGRPCYSMNKEVCYIAAAKDHVKLEFACGKDLEDPNDILQTAGSDLKHVKIKDPGNVDANVKSLIENAFMLDAEGD